MNTRITNISKYEKEDIIKSPSNMKRSCISCDCNNQNLDNENFICKPPVLEKNMKDIILDSDTQLTALQSISQHRNEYNAFFNINLGGWKYISKICSMPNY